MIQRCSNRPLLFQAALLLALPGLAATQAAPPAAAGPGDETFYDSVEVNVVNVEVFVTDRQGRRVTGLTRDDFEVLEDGRPVEVSNFYAAEGTAPIAPAAPGAAQAVQVEVPEEQRLLLAVFVDNLHLTAQARNKVLPAVKDLLRSRLRPGDRVLVASYSGPGTLAVRQAPTNDVPALMTDLDEMAKGWGGRAIGGGEVANLVRQLERTGSLGVMAADPERAKEMLAAEADQTLQEITAYAHREHAATRATIAALGQFVDGLSGLPGRKAVLFISGGLPLRPAQALYSAWENRFRDLLQERRIGSGFDAMDMDSTADLQKVGQRANANRITFYALGALDHLRNSSAATGSSDLWGRGEESLEATNLGQSLFMMAAPTGGLAVVDMVDPSSVLAHMREDMESFYSLGYTPSHRRSGKNHKIQVRVKRPGLQLRHRESYRERTTAEVVSDKVLAALMFGAPENPLEVGLQFGEEVPDGKGQNVVLVTVKLPMSKLVLLPQGQFHEGRVTIFLAARDAEGRSSPVTEVKVPIRVPNEQLLTALGQLAGYRTRLALRPLPHTVAVGVRDELGNVVSTATIAYTPGGAEAIAPPAGGTGGTEGTAR